MSTVEQWAARVARVDSAHTTLNAVDGGRNPAATKPYQAETRRRATRWPNNDEVSADGIGEANGASNAARGQQRVRCSAKRCLQYRGDASS